MSSSAFPDFIRANTVKAATTLALTLIAGLFAGTTAFAGPTATSLSGPSGIKVYGQKSKFTATVYGSAPGGKVILKDGSKRVGIGTLGLTAGTGSPIDGGQGHSCAVTGAGTLECWGRNVSGQLGDGTTTDSLTPVQVIGLSARIKAVSTGNGHTCALTQAGALKCWGFNNQGGLGDGTVVDRSTPVQVVGLTSGVKAVSAGQNYTCAVTGTGAAMCWGQNNRGQLGDDTTTDRSSPVQVKGLTSGVTAIATGYSHTCALTRAGAVKCWGRNVDGQLGDGSTTDSPTPVQVQGLTSGVLAITAGLIHTCALTGAGAVKCWGDNLDGELGNGTTTSSPVPVQVSGLTSGVATIRAGQLHTCALRKTGAVWCWGYNGDGELGDNTMTTRTTPVQVIGLASGIAAIGTSYNHNCAVTTAGAALCWGWNNRGQIGDTTTTDRLTPVAVSGLGTHTVLVPATATIATRKIPAGKRTLKARFLGDTANAASTSDPLTFRVRKGKTKVRSIAVTPRTPTAGVLARIKVHVKPKAPARGDPNGKLVLKDGRKKLGTFKVRKGKASIKTSFATTGAHKLKANYKGAGNWKRSTGKKTVKVR